MENGSCSHSQLSIHSIDVDCERGRLVKLAAAEPKLRKKRGREEENKGKEMDRGNRSHTIWEKEEEKIRTGVRILEFKCVLLRSCSRNCT